MIVGSTCLEISQQWENKNGEFGKPGNSAFDKFGLI